MPIRIAAIIAQDFLLDAPGVALMASKSEERKVLTDDEKDSVGKRYRRQDAIGTPYCFTVDHDTLKDDCVTLRNRDTMEQERVAIADLENLIADRVSITSILKKLNK